MADTRQIPDRPVSSRAACDLCGLGLSRGRVEAAFGDRTYAFCCRGCRQVFTILIQAAGSADPASFRTTELFRRCRESGVIPSSEEELAGRTPAPEPAAPPTPPAAAAGLDLTLKIDAMWCPACAWLVETVVRQQPGVVAAACNFATDRLSLTYDPVQTSPQAITAVIQRYGYRARDPADARRGAESRQTWIRFGISAFLTMNVMMLSAALYFGFFTELSAESVASISWPMAAMAAAVLAYGGAPLAARAWRGLSRAAFSMETLVLVGALSAFGYSLAGLFSGSIHLYFDTASMLITLVLLGKTLEQRAKHRVLEGLERFLSLMPAKVRIVSEMFPDGRFANAGQLAAGDFFRVITEELVAADGVVVAGAGTIEESAITGEPLPIVKKPGDPIRSGSRVRSGALTVCADRVGAESTLGEMLAVVEKTLAEKTSGESRSERWLQWFVPAILGLAAATGGIVAWLGTGAAEAVLRAVTVTVIACPCALGIAIPLARTSGVAIAARKGMLVRNFEAFERVEQLDTVVLDKTGTVTRGDWRLLQIFPLGGLDEEQALALASGLECDAGHPVAAEIVRVARDRCVRPERIGEITRAENGVAGVWGEREVRIGSAEFLAGEWPGEYEPAFLHTAREGNSCVYLTLGGAPAAVFIFGDELREGSAAAVAALQQRGYRLALVSGDGMETTRAVGRRLGISEAWGGQLPADKAGFIVDLQRRGRKVAMVGDGVNDAPALAQAEVSLAVFAGGSLGRDVADATLMRADPRQVHEFLDFAHEVNRKIRQNLILTFIYNGVGIPVAMSGLLSPLVAVGAMLLSSLSVIGNTLRLVRRHA